MRPFLRIVLVAAGYLAAWLVAMVVVAVHEAKTANDARGADGMYAFGDLLLFIAVFGFVALFPTFAAIRFLRARKSKNA